MQKGYIKGIKFIVVLAIAGAFIWFLVLSPMITFHNNEKILEDAARRYFDLNQDQLPTGERVKTLSLNTLYKKAYLKEDFYAPYSQQICSLEKSWVKVRRENGEYKYYIYLDCGHLTSSVDHTGPEIKLKGKNEITVNMGEKFTDPGIKSVVDDSDGKIDPENVTVKGEVNTDKAGTYEIVYTAFDGLSNKTTVTRKVNVVRVLSSQVKKDLKDVKNYTGNPENNYVRLSNMIFRIIGINEDDNIVLVAEEDVANVGYNKLEQWLDDVYIPHFTEEAKKLLVESKFCNMKIEETDLNTTECNAYTKKRYAYVPSVIDVNRAQENDTNFLRPRTISWTANNKDGKEAYITREMFYATEYGKTFLSIDSTYNYGVRPKVVMKGDTLITSGDGSKDNPYAFGETKKGKGGSLLNERRAGEYVIISGVLWRVIETDDDGTTKIISVDTLGTLNDRPMTYSNPEEAVLKYDPKDKNSYGYYINNFASKYIDTNFFVSKEIKAPVYKKQIVYGGESKVNTYKVKLSPPNMFDMFSAQVTLYSFDSHSYWLINASSSSERLGGAITDIGVPMNETISGYEIYGVRAIAFAKKGTVISSGKGTFNSPYIIK